MSQINPPNPVEGLNQHGGLWHTAYHLVHPEGSTLYGDDEFYDVSTIIHKNFSALSDIQQARRDYEEQGASSDILAAANRAPNLVQYSTPGVATPLTTANGARTDLRGDTVFFHDYCGRCGIASPKCSIGSNDPEPPDTGASKPGWLTKPGAGIPTEPFEPCGTPDNPCPPSDGCCDAPFPCENCNSCTDPMIPVTTRDKDPNICTNYVEQCVPVLYAGNHLSTFQMLGNRTNPWEIAKQKLLLQRSNGIETMLINGNGQVNANGSPTYGCLGGANLVKPGSVGVIRQGCPVSITLGIALLEEALAGCLGTEIGMLHLSAGPAFLASEAFYHDTIDYGDGMDERIVQRTKSRGNIVVSGGGYSGTIGPDGCPCQPGESWLYGTGMVYLVYGHPLYTPDRQDINFNGEIIKINGSAGSPTTNDIFVLAEQAIVPIISKCCRFAVKVQGC